MSDTPDLSPQATLGELTLFNVQIDPAVPGQVVANQFEQHPGLSGVLVMDDAEVLGVISRRRFHQYLSQPYGLELFLKRPIEVFLKVYNQGRRPLLLPHTETVDVAVCLGLNRESDDVFEPIVVTFEAESGEARMVHRLLDFQTLLLAQSHILQVVNSQIQEQQVRLERERVRVNEYAQLLEQQQAVIRERNHVLEEQQSRLLEQAHQIEQLNQRFIQIGSVLTQEGKKAFQATFSGVDAICQNTNQAVSIGRSLSNELESIYRASGLIEDVSQQVRHLSVQAGIVANRASSEMSGFSYIAADIAKLVNRTYEASRQINLVADRFKDQISHLTESAQMGTSVARSLIHDIERAATALKDLEALVQDEQISAAAFSATTATLEPPNGTQNDLVTLVQQLSQAESKLDDLRQMVHAKAPAPLVEKIKRTLERNRATKDGA